MDVGGEDGVNEEDVLSSLDVAGPRGIDDIIALLGNQAGFGDEVLDLARDFLDSHGQESIQILLSAINEGPEQTIMGACEAFSILGHRALPPLMAVLRHQDSDVYSAAVLALSELGEIGRPAAPYLVRTALSADPNRDVRYTSILTLGMLSASDEEVVDALSILIEDDDPAIREAAAVYFRKVGIPSSEIRHILQRTLHDDCLETRVFAAIALTESGQSTEEARSALLAGLRSEVEEVRSAAAIAIGQAGKASSLAVPSLVDLLDDDSEDLRLMAALALTQMGAEAIPTLVSVVSDGSLRARESAARAILATGEQAAGAVESLLPLMGHPEQWVRTMTGRVLAKIGESALGLVMDCVTDVSRDRRETALLALDYMESLPEHVLPSIMRTLTDSDPGVRILSAAILASIEVASDEVVDTLSDLLRSPYGEIKSRVPKILVDLGPTAEPAIPGLLYALGDSEPNVRGWCTHALRAIGHCSPAVATALAGALHDDDENVRGGAIEALARLDPPAAVEHMLSCLSDVSPVVRYRAASLLGLIEEDPGEDGRSALVAVLSDGDATVRRAAVRSLGIIGFSDWHSQAALTALLSDPDNMVRAASAISLVANDPYATVALDIVVSSLGSLDREVATDAAYVLAGRSNPPVDAIAEVLRTGHLLARRQAARSLASAEESTTTALTALQDSVEDPDELVRTHAACALASFGLDTPQAIATLSQSLQSRDGTVRDVALEGLVNAQVAAVPAAADLTQHPDAIVRSSAIAVLREIGTAAHEALPALIRTLEDPEPAVVYEALAAVGQMGDAANEAIPSLLELLKNDFAEIRARCAWTLSQIPPSDHESVVNEALTTAMADSVETVRAQAALALAGSGHAERVSVDILLKTLAHEGSQEAVAYALCSIGEAARAGVGTALNSDSKDVRWWASRILKEMTSPSRTGIAAWDLPDDGPILIEVLINPRSKTGDEVPWAEGREYIRQSVLRIRAEGTPEELEELSRALLPINHLPGRSIDEGGNLGRYTFHPEELGMTVSDALGSGVLEGDVPHVGPAAAEGRAGCDAYPTLPQGTDSHPPLHGDLFPHARVEHPTLGTGRVLSVRMLRRSEQHGATIAFEDGKERDVVTEIANLTLLQTDTVMHPPDPADAQAWTDLVIALSGSPDEMGRTPSTVSLLQVHAYAPAIERASYAEDEEWQGTLQWQWQEHIPALAWTEAIAAPLRQRNDFVSESQLQSNAQLCVRRIGPVAVPHLVDGLVGTDWLTARAAARLLSSLGEVAAAAAPALLFILSRQESAYFSEGAAQQVRLASATALIDLYSATTGGSPTAAQIRNTVVAFLVAHIREGAEQSIDEGAASQLRRIAPLAENQVPLLIEAYDTREQAIRRGASACDAYDIDSGPVGIRDVYLYNLGELAHTLAQIGTPASEEKAREFARWHRRMLDESPRWAAAWFEKQ